MNLWQFFQLIFCNQRTYAAAMQQCAFPNIFLWLSLHFSPHVCEIFPHGTRLEHLSLLLLVKVMTNGPGTYSLRFEVCVNTFNSAQVL